MSDGHIICFRFRFLFRFHFVSAVLSLHKYNCERSQSEQQRKRERGFDLIRLIRSLALLWFGLGPQKRASSNKASSCLNQWAQVEGNASVLRNHSATDWR